MVDTAAVKDALMRKVGPLPVVAWVGIGAGGFLVYRVLTGKGASSAFEASTGSGVDFEGTTATPAGGGGTSNPSTTTPTPVPTVAKPKVRWGSTVPIGIRTLFSSDSAAALFKKYKLSYGTTIDLVDLKALFKKRGINYGSGIDSKDMVKLGVAKITTTTGTAVATVPGYGVAATSYNAFATGQAASSTAPTVADGTNMPAIGILR